METLKSSFVLLFLFGFLCLVSSNPISSLFGKSDDGNAEEGKAVKDATEATTTTTTTTTSSSCSGLSNFFHLCDKNEPTEPPKKVKREVSDEDSSDDDSEESKEKETKEETTTSSNSEGEVAKRQVGDPSAPVLGEVPPVVEEAMKAPETSDGDEQEAAKKRRQAEETEEKDEQDEQDEGEDMEETSRRRRDCRDNDGDYEKDCRKKREYVPSCFGPSCIAENTTTADTKEGA